MYVLGAKPQAVQPVEGCNTCVTKTDGNCTNHLRVAVEDIARNFVAAKTMFNPLVPLHIEIVSDFLAKAMRNEAGQHVVYTVPEEPRIRNWFLGSIAQMVRTGLNASAPRQ